MLDNTDHVSDIQHMIISSMLSLLAYIYFIFLFVILCAEGNQRLGDSEIPDQSEMHERIPQLPVYIQELYLYSPVATFLL